jgi:hypothetical protein
MAKHRRMSGRSRRARILIGGLADGGAVAAFAPAGMAAAVPMSTKTSPVTKSTLIRRALPSSARI